MRVDKKMVRDDYPTRLIRKFMIELLLEKERKNKFNDWGKKEPVVCLDSELIKKSYLLSNNKDLSPEEKSAIYLHTLTGCNGFEFILYSNAKIDKPICLGKKAIIYPCFIPIISGMNMTDPYVEISYFMHKKNKYIYDGWISIPDLNEENTRSAIEELKGLISLFSFITNSQCKIETKYSVRNYNNTTHFVNDDNLETIEKISNSFTEISSVDRNALLRSISWLSNGITSTDFEVKFLSFVLSIESLCYYIEEKSNNRSCLTKLKLEKISKTEKNKIRNECITTRLTNITATSNLREEIEEIYFNCIQGSGKRLENHLKRIIPDDDDVIKFFDGNPSLYQIRNNLAHGSHNLIRAEDKTTIINNIHIIHNVASKYIARVINSCIYSEQMNCLINAKLSPSSEGIISNRDMYQGTTDIAFLYYT